jgi:hypothetical protein
LAKKNPLESGLLKGLTSKRRPERAVAIGDTSPDLKSTVDHFSALHLFFRLGVAQRAENASIQRRDVLTGGRVAELLLASIMNVP